MDPDSPISRVERTLWTVWCYITDTVNRFLRPQPADTVSNDPNTFEETSVDSEPPESSSTQADSGGGFNEERPLATVSLLSSSSPSVAWEVCATEIDLRSDEESTQLRGHGNSEGSESGESTREEQLGQTARDDAGLLVAEENEDEHKITHFEQGERPVNAEEHAAAESLCRTHDVMSEEMEKYNEKAGAEEKSMSVDTFNGRRKLGETTTGIQVTKNDGNKDKEELQVGHHEVEPCKVKDVSSEAEERILQEKAIDPIDAHQIMAEVQITNDDGNKGDKELGEDCTVKLCTVTDLGPEPEESTFKEKAGGHLDDHQRTDETTTQVQVTNDGSKDEGELEDHEVREEEDSMFKEKTVDYLDDHLKRDETVREVQATKDNVTEVEEELKQHPEIKLCTILDSIPEEDCKFKGNAADDLGHQQEIDETITEVQATKDNGTEDEKELDELEDHEVKLCTVTYSFPEDEASMLKEKAADLLDDHQKMDEITTEVPVAKDERTRDKEELDEKVGAMTEVQVVKDDGNKDAEELEKDPEIKLCITDLSPEEECILKEKAIDHMDDLQRINETVTEVQMTKDDGNKDGKELEDGCKVKLCTVTEFGLEEGDIMFKEQAVHHLDDHQRMDETTTQVQVTKDDGSKDEEELEVEDHEVREDEDGMFKGKTVDHLDDHQIMDETTAEVQVAKDDRNNDGNDLEVDPEIVLSTILDLSLREENKFKGNAVNNVEDDQEIDLTMAEVPVTKDNETADEEELNEEEDCELKLSTIINSCLGEEEIILKEKAADLLDDHAEVDEIMTEVQVAKQENKDEEELELEDHELKQCTTTDLSAEEGSMFTRKPGVQSDDAVTMVTWEEPQNSEGALKLASEDQNKSDEETKQVEIPSFCKEVSDVLEDAEQENDQTENVTMQTVIKEEEDVIEATNNQTTDEEPEMENSSMSFIERRQEENYLTQYVTCSQEDVVNPEVQTTRETEVTVTEVSLGEKFVDKYPVEEDRPSSEFHNKDDCLENVCTAPSLTVKPEGETEQEISRGFKNIPLRLIEGQVVVSQERDTQVCEEKQQGVPEHNNEFGADENTAQRFLEGGKREEKQITQLPEEVEAKEQESLKNSGTGAGYLLVKEGLQDRPESEGDHTNIFDFVVEHPGKLHLAQEPEEPCVEAVQPQSGYSIEKDKEESLVSPMKTEIKHFDRELETYISSADELQNEAETVEFGATEALRTEENGGGRSHIFPEEITECGLLKQSVEIVPKLSHDTTVETQNIDTDKNDYANEEEEDKTCLQVADEENGESELSLHFHPQETKNQTPNRALKTNELEIKVETEAVDESKPARPNDLLVLSEDKAAEHVMQSEEAFTEEAISSVRGHQEVIDEDILDLWIETAMSEDTCEMEPEGSDPERQRDTTTQPGNEETGEISSHMEKDQLRMSNSVDLAFLSDAETCSSVVESGVLDQPFCESSSQDVQDLSGTTSESVTASEFSVLNSGSQDILLEESAGTKQSYLRDEQPVTETGLYLDSGISTPETKRLYQESDESQEKLGEESAATGAGMVVLGRGNEEADVTLLLEEETFEVSTSDFSDEFKHTESGQWGVDSEASLEETVMLTEPDPEGRLEAESKKIPSLDEDIPDSKLGLNRAEVEQGHTSKSEDQSEVNAPVLDFTVQRSRIAVKNPHVRPPTNPRSLLNMPSVDPTPTSHVPVKVPAGMPLGGLGIGIKLPGLGAGLPVLKKTRRVARDEDIQEAHPQEPEKKAEDKSEAPVQNEAQRRPKWMPPGPPGFGNPLMSELKSKLKKTTEE